MHPVDGGGPVDGHAAGHKHGKDAAVRVLVIDDEPDILGLCEVMLPRGGHEVLQATTADSGLELALEERPDLIVLDIMLPNRDGFALLEGFWPYLSPGTSLS